MPKEIEIPDIPLSQWNGLRSVAQARKNPVPTSYAALSLFVTALMSRWQRSNKSSDKNMLRILETVKTFELYYQATGRNTETDDDYFLSILRPELMQIGLAPLTDRVADHDAAMIKIRAGSPPS